MASPSRFTVVRDERDIVDAIRTARCQGRGIRAAGSRGSKSGAYDTNGVLIRTEQLDELIAIDGNLVTVGPGMTCGRLNALLRRHGLMLPKVGEWEWATVGGSLATATHGGSAHHGIMATAVVALQFVDGEGRVHRLDRGHPDFAHAVVGLGSLGVLTAVTLETEPHCDLAMETDVLRFSDYVIDPVWQESRTEFHASVWIPTSGRVVRFSAERVEGGARAQRRPLRFGARTQIASALSGTAGIHGVVSPRVFGHRSIGDCGSILSPIAMTPRFVRWVWATMQSRRAGELAWPAHRAREILPALERLIRSHPEAAANAIGLRMSAADELTVSPCHGRGTLWTDIFFRGGSDFDDALQDLAARFDARCHWGKHILLDPATLPARYPRWSAFADARRRYDPHQLFANDLTTSLTLTGAA